MADVFISYARSTVSVAKLISEALRSTGYSVWIDEDLPAHRDFPTVIEDELKAAKVVLVLWSQDARASRWVPAEADMAHAAGTLVQLSLDGALPPLPFNRLQCEQAPGWQGDFAAPAWRKVSASIAELVGREAAMPMPAVRASHEARLLAVLAFDNLSGDPDLDHFADGISEEIQHTVARGSDLKVVARASSTQFRGADKAVPRVAAALKTTHLLDGAVRRSGPRVRISTELVECAGGSTLWSSRFDGDLTDIFDLQERIAETVARELKVTLAPPAPALDPSVYDVFVRARGMIAEGNRLFDDVTPEATALLEAVVDAASDYAPAWELLALSRAWTLRSPHRQGDYAQGKASVTEAAQRALRLDPRCGGAYLSLAMLEPWGAYGARERLLQEALRTTPHDPGALTEMATFCWSVGRFKDALQFAQQASEINPLMPSALLHVAEMRLYVGDYEGSIRMHQELHRRWPRNAAILISLLNFAAGRGYWEAYDGAVGSVASFDGRSARDLHAATKYAEALRSGDPALHAERLSRYSVLLEKIGAVPLNLVEALSQFGLVEEALELALKGSYAVFDPDGLSPSGYFPGVVMGPWSALNRQRRFIELADMLGLCAYWDATDRWPDCVAWAPFDFKAEVRRRRSS